ncbi:MAG: hypothetical protein IJW54_02525 [Clostridia bacterium]|nr:hypothetical protein [Clostridia bacterium]
MRKIEKALKNEIKKSARTDFSKISIKCGINKENFSNREKRLVLVDGEERSGAIKRNTILLMIVLICVVSLCIIITKLSSSSYQTSKGYFVIDINPSLEICYDEKGMVTSVNPLNEDAEILLLSLDFSENHYTDAVKTIVNSCIELGYISPDRADNAIMTTAANEDGFKDEYMTNEIKKAFSTEFSSRKILGVVITGVENPELKKEAEKFGIDAQKYALINEYISLGGAISEDEYSEISIRELYKSIYEKEKENKKQLIDELTKKEIEEKEAVIDTIKASTKEIVETLTEESEHTSEWEKREITEAIARIEDLSNSIKINQTIEEINKGFENILLILNNFETDFQTEINGINDKIEALNASNKELIDASKKVEEKREELVNKYGEIKDGNANVNVEEWQETFENKFSEEWFDYKDKWQEDREIFPK